jgi:MFS family permease
LWPQHWRDVIPIGVSLPALGFGLAAYGYGTIAASLVLYLTRSGIGGERVALVIFAVAFIIARSIGSPLVDRLGGTTIALAGLCVEALGLFLVALAGTAAVALLGDALTGAGVSLAFPATVAITLHRTDAQSPGSSVGLTTSCWDLGILTAGATNGAIATTIGYPSAFLAAGAASLVALTVVWTLHRG